MMISWEGALFALVIGFALGALVVSWLIAWSMVRKFGDKWWLRLEKQQLYVLVGDHYIPIRGSWDDPC